MASLATASTPAQTGFSGASGPCGKGAAAGAQDGTFGALFRERAAVVETDVAGKGAEAKGTPRVQTAVKAVSAVVEVKSAKTRTDAAGVAAVSSFDMPSAGANDSAALDGAVGKTALDVAAQPASASTDTSAQAPKATVVAAQVTGESGLHAAMAKPAVQAGVTLVVTAKDVLFEGSPDGSGSNIKDGAASLAKAKAGASASGGATREQHPGKEPASIPSAGMTAPVAHGVIVAAPAPVAADVPVVAPRGKVPMNALVNGTDGGRASVALQQAASTTSNAGQSAAPQAQVSMPQVSEKLGTLPVSEVAADDATLGVGIAHTRGVTPRTTETLAAVLSPQHSIPGHNARNHAAGNMGFATAGQVNPMSTQHDAHVVGAEHAVLPPTAPSAAGPNPMANSAGAANAAMASPFDRIDQGTPPVVLHADVQHVEVGVHDPQLGWVEISAQNNAGNVDARLVAASGQSHTTLTAQLPAIAQYLHERDVRLGSLAVQHPAMQSGMSGGQSGSHASMGGGGAQHSHGDDSGGFAQDVPAAPVRRSSGPGVSRVSEGATLGPVSYISVRA